VAGRAGTAATAGVFERNVEVLGDIEKRLGFAVMAIRQLSVLELDRDRFVVDDEGNFRHKYGP
jgi:hypothetical protein